MSMLNDIIVAMNELGGHCYYKDLYEAIKKNNPNCLDNYANEKNWKASIRAVIERNSMDSQVFQNENLFYSVDGIGKGHWGLVNPNLDTEHMDYTQNDESFTEGKLVLKKHLLRERNHFVKINAIKKFKDLNEGKLYCEICGFDFYSIYGELGKDFIEAHHTKPISEMKENEKTNINDIVLLCSNCHSMIHRKRPWLKKEEIRQIIKNNL